MNKVRSSNTSYPNNHRPLKIKALKKDVLEAISPYHKDNELKLDYIITMATKKG
jgi:hypothetical protein